MTDMELAEEIERDEMVILALTVAPEIKKQIIAALRRADLAQTEIKGHMRIAKEIRIEALKEAAKACELERVAAEETGAEGDIAYNLACEHCATAIRALILKSRA